VTNTFITGLAPPPTHTKKPSPALLYSGGIVEAVHDPNGLFLLKSLFMSGRERAPKSTRVIHKGASFYSLRRMRLRPAL
jgi:hypothetical protein